MPAARKKTNNKTKANKAKQIEVKNNDDFIINPITGSMMPNPRSRDYVRNCRIAYDKNNPDPDTQDIQAHSYAANGRYIPDRVLYKHSQQHLKHVRRLPATIPDLEQSPTGRGLNFVLVREVAETRTAAAATEQDVGDEEGTGMGEEEEAAGEDMVGMILEAAESGPSEPEVVPSAIELRRKHRRMRAPREKQLALEKLAREGAMEEED